jgi:hypothetical protein
LTDTSHRVERREFQRLLLGDPVHGSFAGGAARIVEIGVSGARIEHAVPLAIGANAPLHFVWFLESIELDAQIVRTERLADGWCRSGVLFVSAESTAAGALRRALSASVSALLVKKQVDLDLADFDDTLRPRDARFICYSFEDGVWKKRRAWLPEQPDSGFTVAINEDRGDVQRLCRSWEQSDNEGRRLLRLFCELSISDAMNVPRTSLRRPDTEPL